jgi:hypothetical protein
MGVFVIWRLSDRHSLLVYDVIAPARALGPTGSSGDKQVDGQEMFVGIFTAIFFTNRNFFHHEQFFITAHE